METTQKTQTIYRTAKHSHGGFAALLLVISLSLSLMLALIAASDSSWLLKQDVLALGDRTQRQLAAEACRQLALLYIAEDPDYSDPVSFVFDQGISCSIVSVTRSGTNQKAPFADRIVETVGTYRQGTSTLESIIGISNKGLVEKQVYFK